MKGAKAKIGGIYRGTTVTGHWEATAYTQAWYPLGQDRQGLNTGKRNIMVPWGEVGMQE